ncbi:conserved Plasmodium protein, unknown function [Plasmodium knowlesi strain H]|uniref:Uncharacterized protein n=3 Tax=Plasmodium knowlesi TaxID=5850 RepID=A0A5K1TV02_PLAKH|nr:conserved Plasmodium protein, unknown function [Plasmodium knowlesi strain H]OTN64003.1 Uncharacterized protein PKNOH_S140245100 [Plasmodium knowlesi]CAA9990870.1 conserved Plasmodium protein, unknown function [Plasmodium knowlesi strain H]SBO20906.1 conserved Plasmodium protein, unknown function [Plasmodium knowlesi strain H]SBO21390.1 conserved Plasmodium protein, unknown function [Plasmodium knowlesi strain H]VVS80344.1 conserved Plasmodium protein, unknown function [Plasmodium knowlesi |eukprot:XP_002262158.1 hypothetical protein, conserved in Plasmodium species [Plasmodium knowlesi strain H]
MPNDTRYYYDVINSKWWYFDTLAGGWKECEEVATEEAEEEVTAESSQVCEERKTHKYQGYKNVEKWNERNYRNNSQHVMNGKVETKKGKRLENRLHNYSYTYTPRKTSKPSSESSNSASNTEHYSFKSNIKQHKRGNLIEQDETYEDSYEDNVQGKYPNCDAEENSYDESGGQYDESGGQYDESGGQYDESGGQYDESGGQYDESGGQYGEKGGEDEEKWGYYDEYGGYYDEYGGYYDENGGYYDKNGLYYDGSGDHYDESGVYKGENEMYYGDSGICYDENGHLYDGSEEQYDTNGDYHNDKGCHHDDNDKHYYEDCSENEKVITHKEERGGWYEKGERINVHNYDDKVSKDCAVSYLHHPGKTRKLKKSSESSNVDHGGGNRNDGHGRNKSDKKSEQRCNSSDKERSSYDHLMNDMEEEKKKKNSFHSMSSSDSENSDKLSERINSLLNQSSSNLSILCKKDSSTILGNLLSRSFTRSDHLNSINTIERASEDGKDENKIANKLIRRKTKVNFDEMLRAENNGSKEQMGKGGELGHELVNNTGHTVDRNDKDTDAETKYVPFVRRATRKLTFKSQGGLAGCLKVFQEKKKELMSSTASDVSDMEIKIANLKRRARELAQRYKTKNQTTEDQIKSDQIKTKFEELVFLVQQQKKQSHEKGKDLK